MVRGLLRWLALLRAACACHVAMAGGVCGESSNGWRLSMWRARVVMACAVLGGVCRHVNVFVHFASV